MSGISRELADKLAALNRAIDEASPDERDLLNGALSPFYASDLSQRPSAKARRVAAVARHERRLASGQLRPGTILSDLITQGGGR